MSSLPWIIVGSGYGGDPKLFGTVNVPDNSIALAVRGEMTSDFLWRHYRIDAPPIADPGILLPSLLPNTNVVRVGRVVTIRRFDSPALDTEAEFTTQVGTDFERWVFRLLGCSRVETESLHAAIVADAYGIPWRPLRWELKWEDHFGQLGISQRPDEFVLSDRNLLRKRQKQLANQFRH